MALDRSLPSIGLIVAGAFVLPLACALPTAGDEPAVRYDALALVPEDPVFIREDAGLARGGSTRFTVLGISGADTSIVSSPRWTTSDPSVLRVSEDGTITGVTTGTATITAVAGGRRASRSMGVWQLDSIYIYHAAPGVRTAVQALVVGDSAQKTTHYGLAGGMYGPPIGGIPLSWSISDPAVAMIDSAGMLRARSVGEALLTVRTSAATIGTDTDTQTVIVVAAPLTGVAIAAGVDTAHRLDVPVSGWLHGDMPRIPKVQVRLQGPSVHDVMIDSFDRRSDGSIAWAVRFHDVAAGEYQLTVTSWDSLDLTSVARDSITVVDPIWAYEQHTLDGNEWSIRGIAPNGHVAGWHWTPDGNRAFRRWNDEWIWLPAPAPGHYLATAVNSAGIAVGYWEHPVITDGVTTTCRTAVRWRDAQMELLLGENSCEQVPVAINDRGDVLLDAPAALLTTDGLMLLPPMKPVYVDEHRRVTGTIAEGALRSIVSWKPGDETVTASGLLVDAFSQALVNDSGVVAWQRGEAFGVASLYGAPIPPALSRLLAAGLRVVAINDEGMGIGVAYARYYVSGEDGLERIDQHTTSSLRQIVALTTDGVVHGVVHPDPRASTMDPAWLVPR